jgi:hypothetical protein
MDKERICTVFYGIKVGTRDARLSEPVAMRRALPHLVYCYRVEVK